MRMKETYRIAGANEVLDVDGDLRGTFVLARVLLCARHW